MTLAACLLDLSWGRYGKVGNFLRSIFLKVDVFLLHWVTFLVRPMSEER